MSTETPEIRFRRLYETHYARLLAYASRRCSDPNEAHDVVADTFLVLWRRIAAAPSDDDEVLLWLYGVIRRVLANRDRSYRRRERLAERLSSVSRDVTDQEQSAHSQIDLRGLVVALLHLTEREREILLLAAWENLSNAEIARVLECSENAAAIRLHRARKRLTEVYEKDSGGTGHKRHEWPRLRRPREERQEE
jgi:RNA polymerase sigma-70 factor (ECF subfamily)